MARRFLNSRNESWPSDEQTTEQFASEADTTQAFEGSSPGPEGTSPGGRLVYSTDAMERVLVRMGYDDERAMEILSSRLGCTGEGYPDYVD